MPEPSAFEASAEHVASDFSELASDERIASAAAALERNGVRAVLVATGGEARSLVRSLLVEGAEVFNNTSRTLETIGVAEDIERSGRYGVPSGVNNILVINRVLVPGRVTAILVRERLGF